MKNIQNARLEKQKKEKEKQEKIISAEKVLEFKKSQRNTVSITIIIHVHCSVLYSLLFIGEDPKFYHDFLRSIFGDNDFILHVVITLI